MPKFHYNFLFKGMSNFFFIWDLNWTCWLKLFLKEWSSIPKDIIKAANCNRITFQLFFWENCRDIWMNPVLNQDIYLKENIWVKEFCMSFAISMYKISKERGLGAILWYLHYKKKIYIYRNASPATQLLILKFI